MSSVCVPLWSQPRIHMPKQLYEEKKNIEEEKAFLKTTGCPKMIFLCILNTTITTNVICLPSTLVRTKDTYTQATIWKETTEKNHF